MINAGHGRNDMNDGQQVPIPAHLIVGLKKKQKTYGYFWTMTTIPINFQNRIKQLK